MFQLPPLPVPLLALAAAAVALATSLREPWLALLGVPALLLAPGWSISRRLNRRSDGSAGLLAVVVDAAWLSVPAAATGWAVARLTGLGPWSVLTVAALGAATGEVWARRRPVAKLVTSGRERLALAAGVVLLGAWFAMSAGTIARPLDRYWYVAGVEEALPEEAPALAAGEGWREVTPIGEAGGLLRLRPSASAAWLERGAGDGRVALLLHAPVGAWVEGLGDRRLLVEASPVEDVEEGPVWRYEEVGVAGRLVERPAASVALRFSHPETSTLYIVASRGALWTLDGIGELRLAHYYQLLNMVEQLVWADKRWVTDVQPPLGTWVLGPALALTEGGLPTANVLLLYVLSLSTVAMTRFLSRFAPDAPALAWVLPAAGAVVTGKLLLEPGSAGMPDALYALSIVTGLAGRGEAYTLVAQLLRYPGAAVVAVGVVLAGEGARALRGMLLVAVAAAAFGMGGALTGALPGWLATVGWESGPEHWHGEFDPETLLGRAPGFYLSWLIYAGFTPVLALLGWCRGVRVALGTALIYSLLLATIDHAPTHYFLPLVQLAVCACACASAPSANRAGFAATPMRGIVVSGLGLVGLLIFWLFGEIRG